MRLFLAADVPAPVTEKIVRQTSALRNEYPSLNWVAPPEYHVTIYFFGEQPDHAVTTMVSNIETAAFDIPPTSLFSLETGLFIKGGILMYLSFVRNKDLEQIHTRLEAIYGTQPTGTKHTFIPHITLARYKIPSKQQYFHLQKKLTRLQMEISFSVSRIHLFQSTNESPAGRYKKIHTVELA